MLGYDPQPAFYQPRVISQRDATKKAKDKVLANQQGTPEVLPTRWAKSNKLLLGGFRFGMNYLVAGASGHGKSYLLNMLQTDFLRLIQDGVTPVPFRILHVSLEMSPEDECLRRVSSATSMSYGQLISAECPLDQQRVSEVINSLRSVKDLPIDYVEDSMTVTGLEQLVDEHCATYPDDKMVIMVDHPLLLQEDIGQDEVKMLAEFGKACIRIRKKHNTMIIALGQLNDKIESEKRRDPNAGSLHYPTKTDLHGSKQIYHAMDYVTVLHQPALIGLESYGPRYIPTDNLVAWHFLKVRHGEMGIILLRNDLVNGRFLDWDAPTSDEHVFQLLA